MCGAEKLFYVNITRDEVETMIAVSVWVIFFFSYDFSAWLIIISSGNIKSHSNSDIKVKAIEHE